MVMEQTQEPDGEVNLIMITNKNKEYVFERANRNKKWIFYNLYGSYKTTATYIRETWVINKTKEEKCYVLYIEK